MKIAPYVERLEKSKEYKDFRKKYKNSFMAVGFFVLDLELGKNIHQLDFYVPSEKKIAAFTLDSGVKVQLLETMNNKVPEKLDMNTNVDLDALHGILEDEMKNRNITDEIKKIVAILQNIDGKKLWNLNCVLSGMQILRAHVDDASKSVLKMERLSMMDLMQKVPGNMLKEAVKGKMSKDDVKSELGKLDKMEEEIEKEKKELAFELEKKESIAKEEKEAKKQAKPKMNKK
ncbi:hypothetical protein J4217_00010 [Candidatus Pacearchaeota archaeon]|nr:hypothetical protein [Candidatus Pacearchaeota archaeon]